MSTTLPGTKEHLDDLAESFLMSCFHNGLLRTIKQEHENISIKNIDTDIFSKKLIDLIYSNNLPDIISIRKNNLYTEDFSKITLNEKESSAELLKSELINDQIKNKIFVILGGSGGIGSSLAKFLQEKYKAKVKFISEEYDLAILEVEDKAFFNIKSFENKAMSSDQLSIYDNYDNDPQIIIYNKTYKKKEKYGTIEIIDNQLIIHFNENINYYINSNFYGGWVFFLF